MHPNKGTIWIFLLIITMAEIALAEEPSIDADALQTKVDQYTKDLAPLTKQLGDRIKSDERTNLEVQEAHDRLQDQGFQEKVSQIKERLNKRFDLPSDENQTNIDEKPAGRSLLGANEYLIIFISSAMPLEMVRSYVQEIAALNEPNAKIVLRGFIGGMKKFQPTLNFIQSALTKDPNCKIGLNSKCELYPVGVDIDPRAFRRFDIKQVPTVVYANGLEVQDAEKSIGDEKNVKSSGDAQRITGDVTLLYAMEKIGSARPNRTIAEIVKKLSKRGYYGGR